MTDRTALYRLYAADGTPLYIGITSDPGRRFAEHAARDWWCRVVRKSVEWYATRRAAKEAEEAAIKRYEPEGNSEHCRAPAESAISVRVPRHQLPGIDILRARHKLSREQLIQYLVERELSARGLLGDGPCLHSGLGWPEGLAVRSGHYEDGRCACGADVSDPPDFWARHRWPHSPADNFGRECLQCPA